MDTLACIKRVPNTGTEIVLTDDQQSVDASTVGYTISPHEECAIEEAVTLAEDRGGEATVLTLGAEEATEQLRTALAMGADEAALLEAGGEEWPPRETAERLAEYVDGRGDFDLLLFGNESADANNHQVGVRVASRLGLPCVTGIKSISVADGTVEARREVPGAEEVYELSTPAVVTVREGLNEPRYPSMRAKMRARKQEIERSAVEPTGHGDLRKIALETPETDDEAAEILGESPEAADAVVDLLREDLEVV